MSDRQYWVRVCSYPWHGDDLIVSVKGYGDWTKEHIAKQADLHDLESTGCVQVCCRDYACRVCRPHVRDIERIHDIELASAGRN